jgi:hypothetical protein
VQDDSRLPLRIATDFPENAVAVAGIERAVVVWLEWRVEGRHGCTPFGVHRPIAVTRQVAGKGALRCFARYFAETLSARSPNESPDHGSFHQLFPFGKHESA